MQSNKKENSEETITIGSSNSFTPILPTASYEF
jgi:hypothetical protein